MRIRSSKKELAQAAIELAVFGAILLFVLSVIVRQAFYANFGQNQALRVLRMAMTASYNTSFVGSPARNAASVIVLEDHLSPGLNKYGPELRTPFVASGSATHSRELFQPPTWGVVTELPRIDMFINGQHFQFTVAGYKVLDNFHCPRENCNPNPAVPVHPDWEQQCAYRTVCSSAVPPICTTFWTGCRKFYKVVPNYINDPTKDKFCCDDPPACSVSTGGPRTRARHRQPRR